MSGVGTAGLSSLNIPLPHFPTRGIPTMSTLGRLWQRIWDREEQNKQVAYHQAVAGASAEQARHTEIQRVALKYWSYFQTSTAQAGYLQSAMTQNNLYTGSGTSLLANQANALVNQSYLNQMVAQGNAIGVAGSIYSTPQPGMVPAVFTSTFPGVVGQGYNYLDTFFMTLRGIEEWTKENKIEYVAYDIDALRLSDTREFNPQKIDLLGLASFCLANIVDLDDIIILLEGHGLGVA